LDFPEGYTRTDSIDSDYGYNQPGAPNDNSDGPINISDSNPATLFLKFLDSELIDHLVTHTNLYAKEKNIRHNRQLFVTNIYGMYRYIGLLLAMGLCPQPSYADYWAKTNNYTLFGNRVFKSTCTRDWFRAAHRSFHFDIDYVVAKVNHNNKLYWLPFLHCVVDETLILFKGRWRARQHVRGKPHATGIKLFCIADEKGYIYSFWVYRGKGHEHNRGNTTHDYVWNLVQDLPKDNRQYTIFADQFFGGLDIARTLHYNHFQFVLSCQSNRPTEVFKNYLHRVVKEKGEEFHITTEEMNPICALTFFDSKKCNFLTNVGSSTIVQENRERPRPEIVVTYNKYMNGVDKADAACNLYLNKHRRRKWTKTLVFFLLKMMVTHTLRIKNEFRENIGQKKWKQRDILIEIIMKLVAGKRNYVNNSSRHYPVSVDNKDCGRCSICKTSNASYYCMGCKAHLHPKCWYEHYTGQRIKLVRPNNVKKNRKNFVIKRQRKRC
jgi:hypothetical protein